MTDHQIRIIPLLPRNKRTVEAVCHILGLTNPDRVVGVGIRFGNGLLPGEEEPGTATATIELLVDDQQLRRLVDIATDPSNSPKFYQGPDA